MDVIQIPRSLQGRVSKLQKRPPSFLILSLFEIPPGALWTNISPNKERYGRNKSRPELEAPGNITGLADCQVGTSTKEDA